MAYNYLQHREREALKRGVWQGGFLGLLLGGVVAVIVGFALDSWREANDTRLRMEAVAKVDAELRECKRIALDLGMMEGARSYEELNALAKSVWAAQGEQR